MQAVILAGGQGTRLRPLTETCPKPLLPIANVPMVRRIIDRLPTDVDEVILAVNYRADMLRAYFRTHDVGRAVTVVEETEPLGTAGAIKNVEPHLDGSFFVFNGDVLDSLDLNAMRAFHERMGGKATISLWHVADPRHFGVVDMRGDRIVRFVEKPQTKEETPSNLANAGTYILEPEVLDLVKPGVPTSIERETFPALLSSTGTMHGFPFTGFWVDCGRPDTYLKANEAVLRAQNQPILIGKDVVDHGARFEDWATIGAGSRLGEGVEIARSVVLDRCVIERNAKVRDSILAPGVIVGEGAMLVDCVVGEAARIEPGILLKNVKIEPSSR